MVTGLAFNWGLHKTGKPLLKRPCTPGYPPKKRETLVERKQGRSVNKLFLGCGNQKIEGFIGVDMFDCKGVDVRSDLNDDFPFANDSVDEVIAEHIIEHLNDVTHFLREINRVCINGAKAKIVTPHFASFNSWIDPTHIQHLSVFSIDDYCHNPTHYKFGGFAVDRIKLSFPGSFGSIIGRIIFNISKRAYEKNWCFIFRPGNITWYLRVTKK